MNTVTTNKNKKTKKSNKEIDRFEGKLNYKTMVVAIKM